MIKIEVGGYSKDTISVSNGNGDELEYEGKYIVFYNKKGKLYPVRFYSCSRLILDIDRPVSKLIGTMPDPKDEQVFIMEFSNWRPSQNKKQALFIPLSLVQHKIGKEETQKWSTTIEKYAWISVYAVEYKKNVAYRPIVNLEYEIISNDMVDFLADIDTTERPSYKRAKALYKEMCEVVNMHSPFLTSSDLHKILQYYKITKRKQPLK